MSDLGSTAAQPATSRHPVSIAGLGWITPLGARLEEVWERLVRGDVAEAKTLTNPETGRVHPYAPIPPQLVERLGRLPRLRRASPIAYYAVAAGLAALEHAGLAMTPELAARTAVIFAVSSGSVVYTRKFFEGVVKNGAHAASPMLFPETVYNAPASHLAAQLGIDGYSYTLVGDNSVGLGAMKLGEQLLCAGEADYCLVVGAEEIDWILCEAYRDWRFGALLAEGAGAVLLTRGPGLVEVAEIHDGVSFTSRAEAVCATARVWRELQASGPVDCVIGSANGSWTDRVEVAALGPGGLPYQPKLQLGEALGASALWQVIVAALAVRKCGLPLDEQSGPAALRPLFEREARPDHLPPLVPSAAASALRGGRDARPTPDLAPATPEGHGIPRTACVISTGVNQQASGLVLRAPLP